MIFQRGRYTTNQISMTLYIISNLPVYFLKGKSPQPWCVRLGMSRIAIVADSPPWELGGRWRLDCGANKTAYERSLAERIWMVVE